MGSSRLPGKILMPIKGKPMLWHVINRLRHSRLAGQVAVATTIEPSDDPVTVMCRRNDIFCFRGSSYDVLDRYYQTALIMGSDVIVRITADCPLLDSAVVDKVIEVYLQSQFDYVSNVNPPTYPDGLDVEVFGMKPLQVVWSKAVKKSDREHVTPFFREHPELFRQANVTNAQDLSQLRWTVDEQADLTFIRQVYERIGHEVFSMDETLALMGMNPDLERINRGILRNVGYIKSLLQDNEA